MRKLFILLFFSQFVSAKETNLYISVSEFLTDQRESYVELYFGIDNYSLDYVKKEAGFIGGLEVIVSIFQDGNIITGDRFRINSPIYKDTSGLDQILFHQQRFLLNKGSYEMQLQIVDINDTIERYEFSRNIILTLNKDSVDYSQVLFLESFSPASESPKNSYVRSGYALLPIISNGTPYFPESSKQLSFYNELYNLDKILGENQPFLLRYYIQDESTGNKLNKYAGFMKSSSSAVVPVLNAFNIEKLPSGNYNLVIEALNQKGAQVLEHKTFFYRKNADGEVLPGNFDAEDFTGSFVDFIGNLDSIYKFVEYLYPISSEQEQIGQENLLAEADEQKLKQYFLAFWRDRKPLAPEQTWKNYHRKVREANRLFTSGLRAGYQTDRGRVWLTYGKPDQRERRDMEPNMPAYIIWQYNKIQGDFVMTQNNKMFVFGEFEPSTQEFQLIHSTAIGELQSRDWRRDLYFRAYGGPGNIDPDSDPNAREFGSRTNQNIILGTTGADRINR
jgi:GWxTD domain-containing protein